MANYRKALRGMTQPYRDKLDYMHAAWCVASVPTMAWAKRYILNQKMHYLICGMQY